MAVMQSKATGYDCPQPACPGFDAHAKGGRASSASRVAAPTRASIQAIPAAPSAAPAKRSRRMPHVGYSLLTNCLRLPIAVSSAKRLERPRVTLLACVSWVAGVVGGERAGGRGA
jgi:hypothetical protein